VLRAALVFSGAGLDSAVKHLIRDSLDELSGGDDQVRDEFAKFVERKIGGSEDGAPLNAKLIARSLIGKEPRSILLKEYIAAMTGESLQSVSQLCKVCARLGVSDENVIKDKSQLKRIFEARNKIVHELDVDLGQKRAKRIRNTRKRADMQEYTKCVIEVGRLLVQEVAKKL
jgi:hypothetical protein